MATVFSLNSVTAGFASTVSLPEPGTLFGLTAPFQAPILRGIKVYTSDPFRFDFIIDPGNDSRLPQELEGETAKLVKYFLSALTIPEQDLWVNLSPYEKDRIVTDEFGQTEMGRDLLAQDYLLKQMTASILYPEGDVGKAFWAKVYAKAHELYGEVDIPVDTLNKVWVSPANAVIYENGDRAFIKESHLKVMLESDYLAMKARGMSSEAAPAREDDKRDLVKTVMREVLIPLLETEVNEGKNFATLRQIYQAFILSVWFKRKIMESLIGKAYVDQKKVAGVDIPDKNEKIRIWELYVRSFKEGAYNLIREEYDPYTQEIIPRKYFSGGVKFAFPDAAAVSIMPTRQLPVQSDNLLLSQIRLKGIQAIKGGTDAAMDNGSKAEDWEVVIPTIRVAASKIAEAEEYQQASRHAAYLFVNGFLKKESNAEINYALSRVTKRIVNIDNIVREVEISYYDRGTYKDVFRVVLQEAATGEEFVIMLALKKARKTEGIPVDETTKLELISEISSDVPSFGGRYEHQGEEFFLEEFIEGPSARDLMVQGQFSETVARKVIVSILGVAKALKFLGEQESLPKDIHSKNVLMRKNSPVLVDLGTKYQSLDQGLLRLIAFYGRADQKGRSFDFVYGAFLDVFGTEQGLAYLKANLDHLQGGIQFAQVRGKKVGVPTAKKTALREQRREPQMKAGVIFEVMISLDKFIEETEKRLAEKASLRGSGTETDSAMLRPDQQRRAGDAVGGIDLDQQQLKMDIMGTGGRVVFDVSPELLAQLKDSPGFMPMVIQINRLKDLSTFWGAKLN